MIEENLPSSWVLAKLGEIGQIVSGGTPSTTVSEYWGGDVSWISPVDLSKYQHKLIYKGAKSITELGLLKSSAKLMPSGAVLFSSRAPIGYVAIAGVELCTNQGFKSIVPNNSVFNEYLYYFLKSAKKQADDLASGTTFKEISLTNFAIINIPLPPLAEQHRIVTKIEELFSDLDKGIETLKNAKEQLKVYRQAVLKYAFEGKLTNPDLEDGKLPISWTRKELNDVCIMKAGFFVKASEIADFRDNGSFPCYGGNGLRGYVKGYTHEGTFPLIGRQGALCGNVHLVEGSFHATEHAVVVTPKSAVDVKWLYHILSYMKLNKYSTGTAQPGLSVNKLLPLEIDVPTELKEQIEIVQEIESRLSVCDKIEESIVQGLQQAEALRQSILKKAFEGKLVPQDPNDEPAHMFLEKIKAERTAAQPIKKQKRAKE
jgi:type I restriction enzyme, S subunit